MAKIVNADNLGGDYYAAEEFVNVPSLPEETAKQIAEILNRAVNARGGSDRYFKVVPNDYQLKPGVEFEP